MVKAEAWLAATSPTTTVSCTLSPLHILRVILLGWVYTSATWLNVAVESLFSDYILGYAQPCGGAEVT